MSGLLKGRVKVLAILADLDPVDAEAILHDACRAYGLALRKPPSRAELSEKRASSGKMGAAKRWQDHGKPDGKPWQTGWQTDGKPWQTGWQTDSKGDSKGDGKQAQDAIGLPFVGGRGALDSSLNSESDQALLSGSALKPSSPEGGPAEPEGATAPVRTAMGGEAQKPEALPPPPAPSLSPPHRRNAAALVDHFVAGVGGTWSPPFGQPFTALAKALNLHCDAEVHVRGSVDASALCAALGRRWTAYCGGAPLGALKAIEWLGAGAPRDRVSAAPESAHERSGRAERARVAERDRERMEAAQRAVAPPPEVVAFAATFGRPEPASGTRLRSAQEQVEDLERLERETG